MSVYLSVRDFVITEIALNDASHSGAIANMTVAEYTGARIVSNQHVVTVVQHKTVHCYGSVKICVSGMQMHFVWLKCYISVFSTVVSHEAVYCDERDDSTNSSILATIGGVVSGLRHYVNLLMLKLQQKTCNCPMLMSTDISCPAAVMSLQSIQSASVLVPFGSTKLSTIP